MAFAAVFVSVATALPAARAADAPQVTLPAAPAPGPQEVTGPIGTLPDGTFPEGSNVIAQLPGLRTANSNTYLTSTGSRVLMSYPGPVNYKDASGNLQPIDDTATASLNGGWHNAANSYQATVPSALNIPVSVTSGAATLNVALQSASSSTAQAPTATPTSVVGSASKSTVTFTDPLPDTNVSYAFGNAGVEESLSFASNPTADTYTWTLNPSSGLTAAMGASGAVNVTDASGTIVMVIDAPSIQDANHLAGPPQTMSLSPDGSTLTVSLVPDAAWLSDPSRAFPVALDPTVSIPQSGSECELLQNFATGSYCGGTTSYLAGNNFYTGNAHSLFRFDNLASDVPYDALVQNANFDVYEQAAVNTSSFPLSLGTLGSQAWSPTTATWNSYSTGNAWSTAGGDSTATPEVGSPTVGTANGWINYLPVRQVQAWVSGQDLQNNPPTAAPNQGFMLYDDGAPNSVYLTNWQSSTTSQWPYLSVQYTTRIGTGSGLDILKTPIDDKTTLGVNSANGDLSVVSSLFKVNGVGLPLAVDQNYDSRGATQTSMGTGTQGAGWALSPSFDQPQLVSLDSNNVLNLNSANGTNAVFKYGYLGQFPTPPPGLAATASIQSSTTAKVTFNQSGEIWNFTTISGSTTVYHLSSIVDRNGHTITYAYNTAGNQLTSISDTEGRTVTIGYNTHNLVSSITDSTGRSISYTYVNPGSGVYRLQTAVYGGNTTTYGYDTNGNLNEITDPAGNITTMAYNSSEQVTSVTRVTNNSTLAGNTTTYSYSPGSAASPSAGVTTVTDPNGHATTYQYDPWDRVSGATDPLGHTQNSSYNPESSPMTLTNGLTQITKLNYDTNNNLNQITSPPTAAMQTAASTNFTFNTPSGVSGNTYLPSSSVDAQTNCASFSYDTAGNQTGSYSGYGPGTSCDGLTSGTSALTNAYQGDTGVPSCSGKTGELCTTTKPDGGVTSYSYNTNGELTSIVQPGGSCTGTRKLCTTVTYDGLSRPVSVTDGKNQKDTYSYDVWDRITQILYNGTTTCNTSAGTCIKFTYDGDGNVLTRVDSTGTTTFVYDTLNRLTEEKLPGALDACSGFAGIKYYYDSASNLTKYCDAGGAITYAYDAANRNIGTATGAGSCTPGAIVQPCTVNAYDSANELTGITYPTSTGVTDTLGYDGAGHQTSEVVAQGSTNLEVVTNSYANGATDLQLQHATLNWLTGIGKTYSYDSQTRLTGVAETGTGSNNYGYTYDADGNMTKETVGYATATYTYNSNDALCWDYFGTSSNNCATPPSGANQFTYDANGSQTATTNGESISYNSVNQTTSLTPEGGSALSMAYTGTDSTQRTSAGSTTFANSIFGVAESTTGSTTTTFTRDANGRLNVIYVGGTRYYVYYDGNGSIGGLFNASGTNEASYTYDSYGTTTASGMDASYGPLRFKGGYQDTTGFYKFGTRYYNPGTASWTQQDSLPGSIQNPSTLNQYIYSASDPVNLVDPSGYCSLFGCIAGALNIVAGVVIGATVATACEVSTLGIGSFGCGLAGGAAGYGVTTGLNAFDNLLGVS